MYDSDSFGMVRARQRELLREAEEWRLARASRTARKGSDQVGREEWPRTVVRWGLIEDETVVADLLELNGMPRWVAFEERFIVAERDGEVLAALRYRTEPKRLMLGLLVVDPWAGERRFARALYAGALDLGREMCVGEVLAASGIQGGYPGEAGYRRWGRGWRVDVAPSTGGTKAVGGGLSRPVAFLKVLARAFFEWVRLR